MTESDRLATVEPYILDPSEWPAWAKRDFAHMSSFFLVGGWEHNGEPALMPVSGYGDPAEALEVVKRFIVELQANREATP